MTDTTKGFWEAKNTSLVEADPRDEHLHPESREREPGYSLTETQYLGFNIPEHDIHALCHMWHHPNLGVVSGGVWVWQGIKPHPMTCELYGGHDWIDGAILADDLRHFTMPNSYEVEVIEPLKRLRMRYRDGQ